MIYFLNKDVILILVVHVENGAQFLDSTFVSLLAVTVIFSVTKIIVSE